LPDPPHVRNLEDRGAMKDRAPDPLPDFVPPFTREGLEDLYEKWNRREFVHPDPLEFLYGYSDPGDREIVGILASCLAYGRVSQVLSSVSRVLERLGPSPRTFILRHDRREFRKILEGFKHRFTTGDHLSELLGGIREAVIRYGSLESFFVRAWEEADGSLCAALSHFAGRLGCALEGNMLVPSPQGGSACKRLNLFLRWMVRCDAVDPGGWHRMDPSRLVVPLDTHMHRIALGMGLTRRRQADWRAVVEVTEAFAALVPEDPVRYDFVLTRPGIWASHGRSRAGGGGAALLSKEGLDFAGD